MEPSQIGQPTDATPQTPSSPEAAPAPATEAEQRSEDSRNWFDRVVRTRLSGTTSRGPAAEQSQDETTSAEPGQGQPAPEWKPPSSQKEMDTWYQSRRDKERADDQRRQYQTELQERAQRVQGLEQQKQELLEGHEDWEVGEQVAAIERAIAAEKAGTAQQDREGSLIGDLTAFYDRVYLDPLLDQLPKAERERLLGQPWHGPDGRVGLQQAGFDALKQHYMDEGAKAERARLEKNQSVRKQLAHEFRITREEPDNIPSANGSLTPPPDMNTLIRRAAGR